MLVFSLLSLPSGGWGRDSTVGGWLRRSHPVARAVAGNPVVYAVRNGDSLTLQNPDAESWNEMSALLAVRPRDVFEIRYQLARSFESGLYAPTVRTTTWRVTVSPLEQVGGAAPPLDPKEAGDVQAVFLRWLSDQENGRFASDAARIAQGRTIESRVLWYGCLHNALALAALLLFLYSLAWIPRAPGWIASTRRQRRLARGRCPQCGYPIDGLPGRVCPECGAPWSLTAEDDPPTSA